MPAFKSIAEVKAQVDLGVKVYWSNERYSVSKDYCVYDKYNGYCGGNIDQDNPTEFYVLPPNLIG